MRVRNKKKTFEEHRYFLKGRGKTVNATHNLWNIIEQDPEAQNQQHLIDYIEACDRVGHFLDNHTTDGIVDKW